MNERIKELQIQAEAAADEIFDRKGKMYGEIVMEKFAELIVKECIECADMVGKNNLASGYPNSTAHHVKQKIKEHFGVEE